MFLSLLLSRLVFASGDFSVEPLPEYWRLPKQSLSIELSHGPDKPPPDDGYTFKNKKNSGTKLAKFGFVMLCASGVTAVRMMRAPEGSDLRQQRMVTASALGASGLGLVLWVRLR
ncbi:MAG: hypothetical protein VXZ96_12095 [Myxococcota bacterium]|nr:hypothetical protein [Myxococcota bacterium]